MSRSHIPDLLRELVRRRAGCVCEYCLLHEDDIVHRFHVDHVISEKHGGPTEDHNLALCCPFCNRAKGSDVGSLEGGEFVRLFNTRIDRWSDHFSLKGDLITPLTTVGAVTVRVLCINAAHRLTLRQSLKEASLFPSEQALATMK